MVILDLDLDSSRQSPTGYHGDEVCTPTGSQIELSPVGSAKPPHATW